jgi:hypothetical protein
VEKGIKELSEDLKKKKKEGKIPNILFITPDGAEGLDIPRGRFVFFFFPRF